jgi:hypothetical protein
MGVMKSIKPIFLLGLNNFFFYDIDFMFSYTSFDTGFTIKIYVILQFM